MENFLAQQHNEEKEQKSTPPLPTFDSITNQKTTHQNPSPPTFEKETIRKRH
jgi:hypothetical protein